MRRLPAALVFGLLAATACYDTGELASIEPTPEEIDALVVCDDRTYGSLARADDLDDACRARVEKLLPDPTSSFTRRLIVLGVQPDADGARHVYLQGADARGDGFPASAFETLELEVTAADGSVTRLSAAELAVTRVADLDEETVAVSVVNDHSSTMRDEDLDAVAALERALFEHLPPAFEVEVTAFSSESALVEPFTADVERAHAAVQPGDYVPRERTALYDALGAALERLSERERPVRLLVVTVDGLDNASRELRAIDVARTIADHSVAGLTLGALFADGAELRALFGSRGVHFQAPTFADLTGELDAYLASLRDMVRITIPAELADAVRHRVVLDDIGVVVR